MIAEMKESPNENTFLFEQQIDQHDTTLRTFIIDFLHCQEKVLSRHSQQMTDEKTGRLLIKSKQIN